MKMTNKECREKASWCGGFTYLTPEDMKDLRRDVKYRKENGEFVLDGANGRATWSHKDNKVVLTSYYTDVCAITSNGEFQKLWDDFSVTTLKHINLFRDMWSLPSLSKREWIEVEVSR